MLDLRIHLILKALFHLGFPNMKIYVLNYEGKEYHVYAPYITSSIKFLSQHLQVTLSRANLIRAMKKPEWHDHFIYNGLSTYAQYLKRVTSHWSEERIVRLMPKDKPL